MPPLATESLEIEEAEPLSVRLGSSIDSYHDTCLKVDSYLGFDVHTAVAFP